MIFRKKRREQRKREPRYAKVCPKCYSLNVKISNQGGSAGIIFGAPTIYKCMKCGYSNYAFPEVDLNEQDEDDEAERKVP